MTVNGNTLQCYTYHLIQKVRRRKGTHPNKLAIRKTRKQESKDTLTFHLNLPTKSNNKILQIQIIKNKNNT